MLNAIVVELVAFTLFGALSFIFADRKTQALVRRDVLDDVIYFLLGVIVYSKVFGWVGHMAHWPASAALVGRWPVWLQAIVVFIAYDALQYVLHRWFHGRTLWPFHAVHHSAREIDILTSFRFHPVNVLIYTGVPTAALLLAGFSPAAFAVLAPINFVMSALTHANLNWTYGPFRYLVASPMFHRWHHADLGKGRSCNYAPNFPLFDLMFGTFHMPKGQTPLAYGFEGAPQRIDRQMLFPWRRHRASPAAAGATAGA